MQEINKKFKVEKQRYRFTNICNSNTGFSNAIMSVVSVHD